MSVVHFDGSKEAWHKLRSATVGGSEVASLFHVWRHADGSEEVFSLYQQPTGALPVESLSPYKTGYRLWMEKRAGLAVEDLDEVERIQAGTFMEPAIADWSKARFGWNIRKVHRYLTHDDVSGWGASLDYELHERGASGAPVEIKNVDFLTFRDQWSTEDGEIVGVPLHILLQVQSQIGAVGADHGYVVAAVGGNKLYRGRIDRHEETQTMLGDAISEFWNALAAPEWLATSEVAKEIFALGIKDTTADLTGDVDAAVLARRLMRWNRHAKLVEKITDGLKGRLQMKLGDKTRAKGDGFTVTWPAVRREEKVIPETIRPALDYRGGFTVKETTK